MADLTIHLDVRLTPRVMRWALAALCLCVLAVEVSPESVTLYTYYPAPSGIYMQMVTTQQTILARDGGNVGIGTTSPQAELDVGGTARLDPISQPSCSSANEGTIYYDSTAQDFFGCKGNPPRWEPLDMVSPVTHTSSVIVYEGNNWNMSTSTGATTDYGHFTVRASCAPGGTIISGGCHDSGDYVNGGTGNTALVFGYPDSSGSWLCDSRDIITKENRQLEAYALCTQ